MSEGKKNERDSNLTSESNGGIVGQRRSVAAAPTSGVLVAPEVFLRNDGTTDRVIIGASSTLNMHSNVIVFRRIVSYERPENRCMRVVLTNPCNTSPKRTD